MRKHSTSNLRTQRNTEEQRISSQQDRRTREFTHLLPVLPGDSHTRALVVQFALWFGKNVCMICGSFVCSITDRQRFDKINILRYGEMIKVVRCNQTQGGVIVTTTVFFISPKHHVSWQAVNTNSILFITEWHHPRVLQWVSCLLYCSYLLYIFNFIYLIYYFFFWKSFEQLSYFLNQFRVTRLLELPRTSSHFLFLLSHSIQKQLPLSMKFKCSEEMQSVKPGSAYTTCLSFFFCHQVRLD